MWGACVLGELGCAARADEARQRGAREKALPASKGMSSPRVRSGPSDLATTCKCSAARRFGSIAGDLNSSVNSCSAPALMVLSPSLRCLRELLVCEMHERAAVSMSLCAHNSTALTKTRGPASAQHLAARRGAARGHTPQHYAARRSAAQHTAQRSSTHTTRRALVSFSRSLALARPRALAHRSAFLPVRCPRGHTTPHHTTPHHSAAQRSAAHHSTAKKTRLQVARRNRKCLGPTPAPGHSHPRRSLFTQGTHRAGAAAAPLRIPHSAFRSPHSAFDFHIPHSNSSSNTNSDSNSNSKSNSNSNSNSEVGHCHCLCQCRRRNGPRGHAPHRGPYAHAQARRKRRRRRSVGLCDTGPPVQDSDSNNNDQQPATDSRS